MVQHPRIFLSSPRDENLAPDQLAMKQELIARIQAVDFDVQEFNVSGLPKGDAWTFSRVREVIARCHGAVILGFAQWEVQGGAFFAPTEFVHVEGAIALALEKKTLIIKDSNVGNRGIVSTIVGQYILNRPQGSNLDWLTTREFATQFTTWRDDIRNRHHVFLGYCGKAVNTAAHISRYLQSRGVSVRDWQVNFRPGSVVLSEIEEAARTCLGGIFLFTKDDELVGDTDHAAPRDNVVFEAGFFMHAVGRERTLIIRESGAKMPADLGGGIYVSLADRNNIATIETQLLHFIEKRL